jgi:hypothetical protein
VYRNGSSEGNFDRVLNMEVCTLRRAFYDLRRNHAEPHKPPEPCPNEKKCQGNGCTFCTPIITYIVALTQHNIRIVPAEKIKGKRGILNVPSGTCLDHTVTSFLDGQNRAAVWPDISSPMDSPQPQIFSNRDADGFDFLLTAHGGLKGTSKQIFYRVVSNVSLQSRATQPSQGYLPHSDEQPY